MTTLRDSFYSVVGELDQAAQVLDLAEYRSLVNQLAVEMQFRLTMLDQRPKAAAAEPAPPPPPPNRVVAGMWPFNGPTAAERKSYEPT
jgi:hypothetical protein